MSQFELQDTLVAVRTALSKADHDLIKSYSDAAHKGTADRAVIDAMSALSGEIQKVLKQVGTLVTQVSGLKPVDPFSRVPDSAELQARKQQKAANNVAAAQQKGDAAAFQGTQKLSASQAQKIGAGAKRESAPKMREVFKKIG
jgi:hypothetical protein